MSRYDSGVKLIQLNIERDKHLDRIVSFLEQEQPDIVCLQEVFEHDLTMFAERFGLQKAFAPMVLNQASAGASEEFFLEGVGILSRVPIERVSTGWYFGNGSGILNENTEERDTVYQPLLTVVCSIDGVPVVVGTTHFMKSWHGLPDDYQRERMKRFLPILEEACPDILCGDFNIPRGTELYHILHDRLCDNIPPECMNSIDPTLHRVPGLSLMIDYVWSSPPRVQVSNVRQVCGVSDHCAFVAELIPSSSNR